MTTVNETLPLRLIRIAESIGLAENFDIAITEDQEAADGRCYIQIMCWRRDVITGEMGFGYGGRVYISPVASEGSIVRSIFGAYLAYVEHEARETFTYRERRVFGPHIHLDALHEVARRVDIPAAQHVEDRP